MEFQVLLRAVTILNNVIANLVGNLPCLMFSWGSAIHIFFIFFNLRISESIINT